MPHPEDDDSHFKASAKNFKKRKNFIETLLRNICNISLNYNCYHKSVFELIYRRYI